MNKWSISLLSIIKWITYIFIACAPLVIDRTTLPMGWELPKVTAVVIFSCAIIILYVVHLLIERKASINYKEILLLLSPVFLAIISYLLLPLTREVFPFEKILSTFVTDGNLAVQLIGNPFRHLGIITLLPMFLSIYVLRRTFRESDIQWLALSIGISALVQAGIGLYQYYDVSIYLFSLRLQIDSIVGTFGQPNFLASWLISGFISIHYFSNKVPKYKWIALSSAMVVTIVIILTNSTWATYILAITLLLIFIGEITNSKIKIALIALTLSFLGILFPIMSQSDAFISRMAIWDDIYYIYIYPVFNSPTIENISRFIVGGGPDTLHYTFATHGVTEIIDRAHNIFLDIFTMFGITGLSLSLWGLTRSYRKAFGHPSLENRYILILITIWMLQSSIHTYSILNLYLLLIVVVTHFVKVVRD